jgi:hypothetical protein
LAVPPGAKGEKLTGDDLVRQRVSQYDDSDHDFSQALGILEAKYRISVGICLQ